MKPARPDQYPDYQFLMLAPNLGAEWLFDAARVYWDRFRPTILNDFSFLMLMPPDKSIIVTVIARRDTVAQLGVQLAQISPDAYFDSVVYDLFDDAKNALNARASQSQPFGVAIHEPTPTLDPNAPFVPTPRLFPTNPPAGFITETPPTLTPTPEGTRHDQPQPIAPTPGSVVGG